MDKEKVGKWAFLLGLIVAVIAAFTGAYITASTVMIILFLLGLIVGFLNITKKDVTSFLIALIALMVLGVGSINALSILDKLQVPISGYLNAILGNFIAFVGAAGLVVSIKSILESSKK